ncbi:MAG: class I SAM-dependent methyltransferase [Chlamydiia bacterium]|nr:class I SAM-dependent methyltransferase [Chlamydiia bacterium]MCB1115091.1 class I SAM-dependent methyltransferase [Chlamydiia bacterium]
MSSNSQYPIGYSDTAINIFKERSAFKNGRFLIPHLKETDHLLDCGCGPGSITLDFATLLPCGHVTGIDVEPSQIPIAQSLMQEREITNATFMQGSILSLPFENDQFDVAFTNAVLWTLSDPIPALQELKRVVKPGGIIACREPCFEGNLFYPESLPIKEAFDLQGRAQTEMGTDRNIGKKLAAHFFSVGLKKVELSVSVDVFSSPERRKLLARYSQTAWHDAPWAKMIQEKQWITPERIDYFKHELSKWENTPGAFFSTNWCEAIGVV